MRSPPLDPSVTAEFLDAIVENIPAMVFVKDARDLRFVLFNAAGEQLLGISRDKLIGKTDFDLFPKDQAEFFVAKDRAVFDGGKVLEIAEEPIDTAAGRRYLFTRKIPIHGRDGKPSHLLGISVDITEQREARKLVNEANDRLETRVRERTAELALANEQARAAEVSLRNAEDQVRQSQKLEAIGRLAGGVAHDFNNLLTVVLSYSELLLLDLPPADPNRASIFEIQQAGERATRLTAQLLAFGRRQLFSPRVLDVNQILSSMGNMCRRILGEDVELRSLLSPMLGKTRLDPNQLEQVILNLIVNARDAMPDGGKLTLETANVMLDEHYAKQHPGVVPGPHVMIAISDTGQGMDAATQAQIFEPFFTTKDQGKGTGLGLSTVFGIVQQSGGSIWVYSEPGRGTTFKLYFPRTEDEADRFARLDAQPADTRGGNETILLVEDEAPVRTVTRGILTRLGYQVLDAENGPQALLLCERFSGPIHLLATDVVMPQMSGRELGQRLLALRPDLCVLYMSGYTDHTIIAHGVLEPGINFLQKPITPSNLGRKVREVLDAGRGVGGVVKGR